MASTAQLNYAMPIGHAQEAEYKGSRPDALQVGSKTPGNIEGVYINERQMNNDINLNNISSINN